MMTPWQLHTALWTITLLRREEVEAEGMIARGDDAAWDKFTCRPLRLVHDAGDKSEEVWRAVWRHVPADYRDEPPEPANNIIDLKCDGRVHEARGRQTSPRLLL